MLLYSLYFLFDPVSSAFPLLSCAHRDVSSVLGDDIHHIVLIGALLGRCNCFLCDMFPSFSQVRGLRWPGHPSRHGLCPTVGLGGVVGAGAQGRAALLVALRAGPPRRVRVAAAYPWVSPGAIRRDGADQRYQLGTFSFPPSLSGAISAAFESSTADPIMDSLLGVKVRMPFEHATFFIH